MSAQVKHGVLSQRHSSIATESIPKVNSLKTFSNASQLQISQKDQILPMARTKCGSDYWVKNSQSWNMVSDVMNLPLDVELCVGPRHWSSFDWGEHKWHTENKYFAYWGRSSLFPHVPLLSLPSTPASTAFRREIIRSGTKVFLSHYGLKHSQCLSMLGDFGMEELNFLMNVLDTAAKSAFCVDLLVEFGSSPWYSVYYKSHSTIDW